MSEEEKHVFLEELAVGTPLPNLDNGLYYLPRLEEDLPELPPDEPLERESLEETIEDEESIEQQSPQTSNNNNTKSQNKPRRWLRKLQEMLKFVGINTYHDIDTSLLFAPVIPNHRQFHNIDGKLEVNPDISKGCKNLEIDLFETLVPNDYLDGTMISDRTETNPSVEVDTIVNVPTSMPYLVEEGIETEISLPLEPSPEYVPNDDVEIDFTEPGEFNTPADEAIEEISFDMDLLKKFNIDEPNSLDVPENPGIVIVINSSQQQSNETSVEEEELLVEPEEPLVEPENPLVEPEPPIEPEEPLVEPENPLVEPEEPIEPEEPLVEPEEPLVEPEEPLVEPEEPLVEPEPPIEPEEPLVIDASGGNQTIVVEAGDKIIVTNFTGVGRGTNPSQAILEELDTLQFVGEGLEAHSLLFSQEGEDLVLSFEGDTSGTRVVLQGVQLEDIDNIPSNREDNSGFVGNLIFDGDVSVEDSIDVFNAEWNNQSIFNRDTLTILNDLDNDITGFDDSADVINAAQGDDNIQGLSGDDILRGEAGNDTLLGGAGDDTLVGGLGDDFLNGGTGNNRYTGGAGSDNFILSEQNTALITDFTLGEDQLILTENFSMNDIQITLGTSTEDGSSATIISDASGNTLAILSDIHPDSISQSDFGFLDSLS